MKRCILFSVILSLTISLNIFPEETHELNTYVGVYLVDVSGFEISEGRFNADLIVWLKWFGDAAIPPFTFSNGEIEKQDEVANESDGKWHSIQYHVQGTFRGTFPLQKFPFDKQQFKI